MTADPSPSLPNEAQQCAEVDALIARARAAQQQYVSQADQQRFDLAALAIGWAIMEPQRNQRLSEMAVADTGLGNVADKIRKNHRKTLGLLQDIQHAKTYGMIEENSDTGLVKIARPKGVIGAVIPSTNPVATPTNNTINALKCGNAIILAPSPRGANVCRELLQYYHEALGQWNLPTDLVQMLSMPPTKVKSQHLMENVDLLVVTGSQDNVRRAYRSGTPALGVGAGNVTVIVDETADLADAAEKITASKTFDNATSCSSENALVVCDAVYDDFLAALDQQGGRMLDSENAVRLKKVLFTDNGLGREIIARDIETLISVAGLEVDAPQKTKFVILPGEGVGKDYPESGEKLSLVATLYRAADFDAAARLTEDILSYHGAGHSVGIHTRVPSRPEFLGLHLPTCRVIVNQAHCFATGGDFINGMPFSLSMGCGSWGGNSLDENLHYTHFMNITKVVRTIPSREPEPKDIFARLWQKNP